MKKLSVLRASSVRHVLAPTLAVVTFLAASSATPARADEVERTRALVATAAEVARDERVREGAEALGAGVTFAGIGVASWATPSTPDSRKGRDILGGVFVGAGSALVLGSVAAFAMRSDLEVARDAFDSEILQGPAAFPAASARFERALFAAEKAARTDRTITAVTSFVFAAAEIVAGIAVETETRDDGTRWLGRSLMVGGVGSAILGGGALLVRSETERVADVWRARPLPDAPTAANSPTAIRVVPRFGIGVLGLAGSF
ncbi:MAG: hypothetical protein U0169_24685 [Polyangiaceae bacterium]